MCRTKYTFQMQDWQYFLDRQPWYTPAHATDKFSQKINSNRHYIWINTAIQQYFKINFQLNTSTIIKVRKMLSITEVCGNDLD